jgi:hypothetical protein
MVETFTYGGDTIQYEVSFLASRRTLAIEVHPDCRVLVRAPQDCDKALIAQRVQKRARWISRQIEEFERYRPRTPPRQYVNGESHLYLGRQYRLKISAAAKAGIRLSRGNLLVSAPGGHGPQRINALLDRWYLERARFVFGDVLKAGLDRFRLTEQPRLVVRTMRSRWGSLSPSGTMTLNVNLVRAPRRCIEYVVTHELCHLRHRNHEPRFFKLLGQVMPDWQQRKERLERALL